MEAGEMDCKIAEAIGWTLIQRCEELDDLYALIYGLPPGVIIQSEKEYDSKCQIVPRFVRFPPDIKARCDAKQTLTQEELKRYDVELENMSSKLKQRYQCGETFLRIKNLWKE